jgi:hypothetical protein
MATGQVPGAARNPGRPTDRSIIVLQLALGTFLVVFGALLLVIFKATDVLGTPSVSTIGGNVATGVLGVGAALLPAGAAGAASTRILAQLPATPATPATPAPAVTGVRTSAVAGATTVSGEITTLDDGFWFVQHGSEPGNYTGLEFGGRLSAQPAAQDISAPAAYLTPGLHFRVGFTTNSTGQTAYSKDTTVA